MFDAEQAIALLTVIGIDLILSGDNAVVIGTAAAGLPPEQRRKAISFGIIVAAATRMVFAMVAFSLLKIVGLILAGGLLLLCIAWKMWRDIRREATARTAAAEHLDADSNGYTQVKSFRSAVVAIALADVSMSLDNILAVTGAVKDHFQILIFGLALSIALMGVAANFIAGIMNRYHWISYVGVGLIVYVALDMTWRGSLQVYEYLSILYT